MGNNLWLFRAFRTLGPILAVVLSTNVCASFLEFGGTSWKEEAQQYNGSTIIVERSQHYGGPGEVGQGAPIRDYRLSFTLPGSARSIEWKSDYSEDVGRANLHPLALHVLNGTPYIVAEPNLCLAYNKWGRPNPPYVVFRYDGKQWQRITIEELPTEFKGMNLVIDTKNQEEEFKQRSGKTGFVPAADVQKFNGSLTQPEYKTILREPYPSAAGSCSKMIRTDDGWEGLGFFKLQKSYEACLKYCEWKAVNQVECPCKKLFKGAE